MKYFLLSLSAILILAACQKTPKATVTKQNTLRNSRWKLASGSLVVKLPSGKDTTLDLVSMLAPCNQDDYIVFDSIYTGAVFSGSDKCSPSDPDSVAFTWQVLNNNNTINFNNAINFFYVANGVINPATLDTVSINPFVQDTVYPVTYTLSPFDTTTISASITSFSTSSFTINYNILSTYLDTTMSHLFSPVMRPDTVSYTVTYNSF